MSQYRAAMDNAWAAAANRFLDLKARESSVALWLAIAEAELKEPIKMDRVDSFNWAPPTDGDSGVVGNRCLLCRHFEDNHGIDGCRECGCEIQLHVA